MHSSLIGKLEKAKRYAQEPDRVTFETFQVTFRGDNDVHTVGYGQGNWQCSCAFFIDAGRCSHTIAMEKILDPMLTRAASSEALAV